MRRFDSNIALYVNRLRKPPKANYYDDALW